MLRRGVAESQYGRIPRLGPDFRNLFRIAFEGHTLWGIPDILIDDRLVLDLKLDPRRTML